MTAALPDCSLIDVLEHKAQQRNDTDFDYLGRLRDLRATVVAEVRSINELFPEYTPHDDAYHLSRLFNVADMIITRSRFETMNATELFILSAGLYAHDWGMAVSNAERQWITTGTQATGTDLSTLALLPKEPRDFRQFLSQRGVDPERDASTSLEHWRDYVRLTHARRSAERIRRFLTPYDSGAAEAVARVCEGHWLDFEVLHNHARYPVAFSVLRESTNLAALAVYVRLVDLLDIASDRTPYVIWKFVAPTNPSSRMEWAKHRALQPVTCPPYQGGRIIQVDGSTDDHEVFAALEDLRGYCELQVRGCTDLLARINDPRHRLDLYHIDWRVAPRNFEPLSVRFEFDRESVFDILGEEIYQGDAYVFLRELLQNSVDAIRARREILRSGGVETPRTFGLITVEVVHESDGDACIVWTDNGIGMDIYIVRNYLAVAGRSFYRSDDFKRLGLRMDPISRFGIGILSCFMVADGIEIETQKDPYAQSPGSGLRISIPSVNRQFRIEAVAPGVVGIGTRVTVHLRGHKVAKTTQRLKVTEYLQVIAGFVEFPVLVHENGLATVILHPRADIDVTSDERFRAIADSIKVRRATLDFNHDEVFVPQDRETAAEVLELREFDLQIDLGLQGLEGKISYAVARDPLQLISRNHDDFALRGIELRSTPPSLMKIIRWGPAWSEHYYDRSDDRARLNSQSASAAPSFSLFKDGILVPNANMGRGARGGQDVFPLPRVVVNIKGNSDGPELNIARTELRGDEGTWFWPIRDALHASLSGDLTKLLNRDSDWDPSTLLAFGTFVATFGLGDEFFSLPVRKDVPVVFLTEHGRFQLERFEVCQKRLFVIPQPIDNLVHEALLEWLAGRQDAGTLSAWESEPSLFRSGHYLYKNIEVAVDVVNSLLLKTHQLAGVRFLAPPDTRLPPLLQERWDVRAPMRTRNKDELARLAQADPATLSPEEREALLSGNVGYLLSNRYLKFAVFPAHETLAFRSADVFNLAHPLGNCLHRAIARLHLASVEEREDNPAMGRLQDQIGALMSTSYFEPKEINAARIASFVDAAVAMDIGIPETVSSTPAPVWWGSRIYDDLRPARPFGQVIAE